MALPNKLIKSLLPIMLLFCASNALAFTFGRAKIKVEDGMAVPWPEIKEAILKPSNNAFDSCSFVVEDFRFLPIPNGKAAPDNIPLSFLAVASLLGFQASNNRYFDFFNAANGLLNYYDEYGRSQVKQKLLNLKSEAEAALDRHYPDGRPVVSDAQLLAYWLHAQNRDPAQALRRFYEAFYIERRPNTPHRSRAQEAKLILMHGLPFFILSGKGGFICLGFFEKGGETAFVMVDYNEVKSEIVFSFLDEKASARPMATVMRWQPEWEILYVPRITRAYDPANRMRGIKTEEEE